MSASTIPVTLSMPPELVARLDAAAAADDRSRSATVRRVLERALADHDALHEQAARTFDNLQSDPRGAVLPAATLDGASAGRGLPPSGRRGGLSDATE